MGSESKIAPGLEIGQYRVESKLGEGGVGSVFRALDTKLNRPVAIKVLSSGVADTAARKRFQREAQLASSLNHPHILTVHDAGEFEGQQYLVTEFIDGGTLKDWIKQEPRTWQQIVELLTGVADGLAAAHQAGIIHRDIKPANILITKSGYAKLADFGLARLTEPAPPGDETQTLTEGRTQPGHIVGTVAYMSPEQASGLPLDARSDIFSFGIVLYEMFRGKRPFTGNTHVDVMHAIVRQEPEPLSGLPANVCSLVERAMKKDAAQRYPSMRELVTELKECVRNAGPIVTRAPEAARAAPSSWNTWIWAAGGIAVLAIGLAWWARSGAVTENPLPNATSTPLTNFPGDENEVAISRDGRFVAFRSDKDAKGVIDAKDVKSDIDTFMTQAGSGNWINLTHRTQPRVLVGNTGFSWDGSEVWLSSVPNSTMGLRLIPSTGGQERPFLDKKAMEPAWSPDGNRVVFQTSDPKDPVLVADRSGVGAEKIFESSSAGIHNHFLAWSKDGEWIYFVSGSWISREMDIWRMRPTGADVEQLTHIGRDIRFLKPFDARTFVYVSPDEKGGGPWLYAFDTKTRESRRWSLGLEAYTSVDVSEDGTRLVASVAHPEASLFTVPILDKPAVQADVKPYALPSARAFGPRFGGERLFFLSSLGGGDGLWRFEKGQLVEIWKGSEGSLWEPPAISADGMQAAVVLRRQGKRTLNVLSADGGSVRPLGAGISVSSTPSWSPDGTWIAGGVNEGPQPQLGLFKIPVAGGEPIRLAQASASDPVWSPDGSMIVYTGPVAGPLGPVKAVRPDGTPVALPDIKVRVGGERYRFIPGTLQLVVLLGTLAEKPNFFLIDLATGQKRQLSNFDNAATRTFDITPDGKQIVFDQFRENSDVMLIDVRK